jgi:hypothetical protein
MPESLQRRARAVRFPMKKGSAWLCAAGACGAAVALSYVLLWGDGSPQIPGGSGPWGRSIWRLPDGLGLVLLVVLIFGVPLTAVLTFIGLILRLGPRSALWISGGVLLALVLIL